MKDKKQKSTVRVIVCLITLIALLGSCPAYASASDAALGENEIPITETTFVDDFECKIKEVNWYSPDDFGMDIVKKQDGFEYIVIVLSETNTTNDTKNAPALNLLSADGMQCMISPAVLRLYKNQYKINFGATMAQTTAESYFVYQIPSGSQSFKLQILSNGFGKNSKYIVFNRDDIK